MSIASLYQLYLSSEGVTTDTRKISQGQLFFALKGPNFNGNLFAEKALEAGAKAAIVDEAEAVKDERFVLVDNVLKSLQQLANLHRKTWKFPVIAITGSNGKTTTKELLTLCLKTQFKTFATPGNFNNHIGLPLTILGIPSDAEMAILEMGDNQLGDIAELCQIAEPTHGVITNIGKDHIEGYGSFEGNIRAKSELFDFLLKSKGQIFVNREDGILKNMAKRFTAVPAVWYGGAEDQLQFLSANPFIKYQVGKEEINTQLLGKYNLYNLQTARAIALNVSVSSENINQAFASYRPSNNRSQWVEKGSNQIILDAYNANPSSVELAIENLKSITTTKKKVCILGDMFELGSISEEEHKRMVELAVSAGFDLAVFIGERYEKHATSGGSFFRSKPDFETFLKGLSLTDAIILIKGSRKMALETLVELV